MLSLFIVFSVHLELSRSLIETFGQKLSAVRVHRQTEPEALPRTLLELKRILSPVVIDFSCCTLPGPAAAAAALR